MRVANPELYDTVAKNAVAEIKAPYIVYCANCAETFSLQDKEHVHVLDFILGHANNEKNVTFNTLQNRRNNAIQTKALLSELYGGVFFSPKPQPWDALDIDIPAELLADMNHRLILEEDIKEVIYKAECSGEFFILPEGASDEGEQRRACLIRDVITIWVQWTPAYAVKDVWSHRMRFSDNE